MEVYLDAMTKKKKLGSKLCKDRDDRVGGCPRSIDYVWIIDDSGCDDLMVPIVVITLDRSLFFNT